MPTKSELEGRASRIVQVFQKAMPPLSVQYPAIIICTQRTYRHQRAFLVARMGSSAISAPTDDMAVEVISGTKGAALLVRKEEVPSLDAFYHLLWVALGRFYLSVSTATQSTEKTMQEESAVVGEAFWSVFASEAIANRVERFLRTAAGDTEKEIEWPEEQWRSVYDEMKLQLLRIYGQRNIQIPDLAFYLASALTDDLLEDMSRRAREGKLPGREGQPFNPVGVEMMPQQLQSSMKGLITVLEGQMTQERYWEASKATLSTIGELLTKMNEEYVSLIADQIALDELDAAPIPKVLPEDLWDDLPEIE